MSYQIPKISCVIEIPTSSIYQNNKSASDFFNQLIQVKRAIVFSPHLDDAVLSAGSLISHLLSHKVAVEVITLFTEGSPITSSAIQIMMSRAGFDNTHEYFSARRAEDIVALKELGTNITIRHLGYTDAAWRTNNNKVIYPDTQLAAVSDTDKSLYKNLISEVKKQILAQESVIVFTPLARGKHVDHQITRDVITEVFPQVIYYEDFPYSALYQNEDEYIHSKNLVGYEWFGDYERKKNAILKYVTQKAALFGRGTMRLPFEKYYITQLV